MSSYLGKSILIIGAGELQIPIIKQAKKLGLKTIVSDQNPTAPGLEFADYTIIANTLNAEESLHHITQFCEQHGAIDGVVTAGTDASYTVAYIANHFGLAGHRPEAALRASNKIKMRQCFAQHNVPIPQFKEITTLEEAQEFFEKIQNSCVIKPPQNMGARGISLVRELADLESAFLLAQEFNKNQESILIEEFIDAHELSIDALVHNDTVTITGIADRIIEYAPYFVETGHILPSALPKDWLERAVHTFRDGIKALGLHHGAAKADLKISKDQTWIIEIAARLSGGFMSAYTFPLATGIDLNEQAIKLALGEKLSPLKANKNLVSVERAIIFPAGTITDIQIDEHILDQEFIKHLSFRSKVGDEIKNPKNNIDKSGNIIATAPTRALAFKAIQKALKSISVRIEPSISSTEILKASNENAKTLLKGYCAVCRSCDGNWCRGNIPGVGGVGNGEAFIHSYQALKEIKLLPNYINNTKNVDTSLEVFGHRFGMPIFTAPIGGAQINYNCSTELELQRAFAKGAYQAQSCAFLPDPASSDMYPNIAQSILENYGFGIPICKPREDLDQIKKRYQLALTAGAFALGMDIDGIGLKTFSSVGENTVPKSGTEIKELIEEFRLPFVVKGILSVQDAQNALEAGATHLVVSSHGGRISDAHPAPIEVLPEISDFVQDRAFIFVDGAIRTGSDIAKAIILGADAVLIGRPCGIHAMGGGHQAVYHYLINLNEELRKQMLLLGVSNLEELKQQKHLIYKK